MNRVAFDTLAFAKHLQEAGVPSVQAEAHATAQADFLTHQLLSEVATKSDLAELQAEVRADLTELKAELKADLAEVKADLAEVKAELQADLAEVKAEMKADLTEVKADLAEGKAELKADLDGIRVNLANMETKLSLQMLLMVSALAALMSFFKFMG